jgi:CubicO group peptidase (beta-lactamase class C family)
LFYFAAMRILKISLLYIIPLVIVLSCNFNNNSKAAPPLLGNPPKFSKIDLKFTDTNTAEMKKIINSLDTFYNTRAAGGFNGSVIVASKGQILFERYYGFAQVENGLKVSAETPSQLASTSKPFTAAAICLLKDRGLLQFDDLVTKFIPSFPYPEITIRNLLTHRSGLPDYFHFAAGMRTKDAPFFMTNQDLVDMLAINKPKLNFIPNTRFTYCNTNFALLAYIVAQVSKMPFPKFMKTMLFEPLGMSHSYIFDATQTHNSQSCKSYKGSKWNVENDMFLDGVAGDKGAYSTVEDMLKWDQALYGTELLKANTLAEAYSPYSFEKPGVKNYGLGWRMLVYPEQKIIFHNGWWHGNNTAFYRFVNENFTVIVLGNKYNRQIYYHPQAIYNIIKGKQQEMSEDEGTE